jgi:hypothetical protein
MSLLLGVTCFEFTAALAALTSPVLDTLCENRFPHSSANSEQRVSVSAILVLMVVLLCIENVIKG